METTVMDYVWMHMPTRHEPGQDEIRQRVKTCLEGRLQANCTRNLFDLFQEVMAVVQLRFIGDYELEDEEDMQLT